MFHKKLEPFHEKMKKKLFDYLHSLEIIFHKYILFFLLRVRAELKKGKKKDAFRSAADSAYFKSR